MRRSQNHIFADKRPGSIVDKHNGIFTRERRMMPFGNDSQGILYGFPSGAPPAHGTG